MHYVHINSLDAQRYPGGIWHHLKLREEEVDAHNGEMNWLSSYRLEVVVREQITRIVF